MFRNARLVIGLCALAGVSLAGLVGWATGLLDRAVAFGLGLWDGLMAWISSPITIEHAFAGLGVLLVPLIGLALLFVITDS